MFVYKNLTLILSLRFLLLLILIVLICKYVTRKFSRDPRLVDFAKKLPGPFDYPIIGNSTQLLQALKNGIQPLLCEYMIKYGSTTRLWLGAKLAVLLSDEKDVEAAYFHPNCLSRNPEMFRDLLGNCLLIAKPVEIWKRKRKSYQPFFGKPSVIQLSHTMNGVIYKYIEKLKKAADGPEIDTLDIMAHFATDITLKIFFSCEMTEEEKLKLNFERIIQKMFTRQAIQFILPLNIVETFLNWRDPMDVPKLKAILEDFIKKMIYSNIKAAKDGEETLENKTINSSIFSQSFIETIEVMKKELDDDKLIFYEVIQWILVGSDSVSTTLANCLLALAATPDVQEKVYQELYQEFGDDGRFAESSDLKKLPYLSQVLKESQRLLTLVPFSGRFLEQDTQIGEHTYPKGVLLLLNLSGIHHNEKLYPQPHDFNPDNFAPNAVKGRHRCSFLAFGAGPRDCLGKAFGEQVVKLMIIAILRNFSLHTDVKLKDVKPKPSSVLLSQISNLGYPIRIKIREKKAKNE